MRLFALAIALFLLIGCTNSSRYTQKTDSAPNFTYPTLALVDAIPKYEPYRPFNLRQYEVLGKTYTPLKTGKGFVQEGYASWYGQKFHGHLTSIGDTYDMFAMTAAHKTLPLPSYVKVTNQDNGKTAIVRVNDRGPFHSNRIIDLSYAAAKKLGFHQHGTTKVKLEVIHFDEDNQVTVGNNPTVPYDVYAGIAPAEPVEVVTIPGYYIQVAALSDKSQAESISSGLSSLYQVPSETPLIDNIYKLRLGPLKDRFKAKMLLDELRQNGYPGAYTVEVNL